MKEPSFEAKSLTRVQIRQFAFEVRKFLCMENVPYIDIERLIEIELPRRIPEFIYDLLPSSDLDDTHGFAKLSFPLKTVPL